MEELMPTQKSPALVSVIITIIIMLIVGTILVSLSLKTNLIKTEEAIHITDSYSSYTEVTGRRGRCVALKIHFENNESISIKGRCVYDGLKEAISSLPEGTEAEMLIHPDSYYILDLKAQGETILNFDHSIKQFATEKYTYLTFGILSYVGAVIEILHAVKIIKHKKDSKKTKKKSYIYD